MNILIFFLVYFPDCESAFGASTNQTAAIHRIIYPSGGRNEEY